MSTATATRNVVLESTLEAELRNAVRIAGGRCYKIAPVEAGLPDRMVLLRGRIILVELKRETGRLRPAQEVLHERIRRETGVEIEVVYGSDGIRQFIARHVESAGVLASR